MYKNSARAATQFWHFVEYKQTNTTHKLIQQTNKCNAQINATNKRMQHTNKQTTFHIEIVKSNKPILAFRGNTIQLEDSLLLNHHQRSFLCVST